MACILLVVLIISYNFGTALEQERDRAPGHAVSREASCFLYRMLVIRWGVDQVGQHIVVHSFDSARLEAIDVSPFS